MERSEELRRGLHGLFIAAKTPDSLLAIVTLKWFPRLVMSKVNYLNNVQIATAMLVENSDLFFFNVKSLLVDWWYDSFGRQQQNWKLHSKQLVSRESRHDLPWACSKSHIEIFPLQINHKLSWSSKTGNTSSSSTLPWIQDMTLAVHSSASVKQSYKGRKTWRDMSRSNCC